MDSFKLFGQTYTKTGNAWVADNGAILGQSYCDGVMALAPAIGRHAVAIATAVDEGEKSTFMWRAQRSLGNAVLKSVMALASELRRCGVCAPALAAA